MKMRARARRPSTSTVDERLGRPRARALGQRRARSRAHSSQLGPRASGTTTWSPLPPVVFTKLSRPLVLETRADQRAPPRPPAATARPAPGSRSNTSAVRAARAARRARPRHGSRGRRSGRARRGRAGRRRRGTSPTFRFSWICTRRTAGGARPGVLLVEAFAAAGPPGSARGVSRPVATCGQDPVGDRLVEARQLELGDRPARG